jgi:pimeloyl-ACP methyl ester carboxylesterase
MTFLSMAVLLALLQAPVPSRHRLDFEQRLAGSPWTQYRVPGVGTVTTYIARDATRKPVVVLLQGSGCVPLFTVDPDGTYHGTSLFDPLVSTRLSRFHFVMVEKRGVEPLRFRPDMTIEQRQQAFDDLDGHCTPSYEKNDTKTARVEDAATVIEAVRREPWAGDVLVVGHSEGSQVATGLVRALHSDTVQAVGLLSSSGPTQFFGMYVARGAGDPEVLRQTFDAMRRLEAANDDASYEGHPARRWKSYALDSTPLEDVRDSVVPLFVAHGGRERNRLAADLFVLEALRQQPHRSIRYVIVDDGDHGFETTTKGDRLPDVFDDFLGWALNRSRTTELVVMH